MYDPLTLAFEIKYPWRKNKPWPEGKRRWEELSESEQRNRSSFWKEGYRNTFVAVWHKDPEHGSDDSCGYSRVRLTKEQVERLRNAAWSEGRNPHFLICPEKEWFGNVAEVESLFRGMVLLVCRVLDIKMSFDEISRYAAERVHFVDIGKSGNCFCFVPGYHTNSKKDSADDRQDHFCTMLCGVASGLLTLQRPWYRKPKWHVWHWRLQVHPWQTFYRWAFERCSKCGGRFAWGTSDVIGDWNGTRIWHGKCDDSKPVQE